ncbi:MAG: DUF6088 family protein [Bacteroidetes bacterium]|nr:DUF6088 family protein [Bacteroidota bacterium]
MKVTDYIADKINRLPLGYVFTYDDFELTVEQIDSLIKALGRMVNAGKIRRLSPGRFYKPRITEFGELKPEIYQVVKDLLERDGKITGYLTGYSTFNQLGLTTQVSGKIQIGTNNVKKGMKRGMFSIGFTRQANRITKENIPLLRMLDAIQSIKEIPDSFVEQSCKILLNLINTANIQEKEQLASLALKYKPATRALTGAMIEMNGQTEIAIKLLKSLNPASTYTFNISEDILPNKGKWNII